MPEAGPSEVRIYCLCGQKMRIASAMFGQPGKCVACRQKILIPMPDEIPDGGDALYLKDHPEFLRSTDEDKHPFNSELPKPKSPKKVRRKKSSTPPAVVALDVLEPLRILCNFDHKIRKKLKVIDEADHHDEESSDRASLMGYRVLLQNFRNDLDNQIRLRLSEVNDQLNDTKEQIARPSMAVRIGKMDYPTFREAIRPLRKRREVLYRRRRNLEGWLAVTNRNEAGGFLDVKLQDIPCEPLEFESPPEPEADPSLIQYAINGLRDAFLAREHADRKLNEWKRMGQEEAVSPAVVGPTWAETKATRTRAKGAIAYFRERLGRLVQDYTNDIRAIKEQLEIGREQLKSGDIDKGVFQPLKIELLRAQADNVQANDFLKRALNANSAADVPALRGTFLERLDRPTSKQGIGLDSWIAWAASALMILTIFAPISNAPSSGNMVPVPVLVMALFVGAGVLAMLAAIPKREQRGTTISLFWMIAVIFVVGYVHELRYSLGEVGVAMRKDPRWLFKPGILLLALDILVIALAAMTAIGRHQRLQKVPLAAAILALISALVIGTNVAGQMIANPYIEEPRYTPSNDAINFYDVTLQIKNEGWRAMWLGADWPRYPTAITLLVERKIGSDSWLPIATPPGNGSFQSAQSPKIARINPGDQAVFQYALSAGTYQIQVFSQEAAIKPHTKTITLAALTDIDSQSDQPDADPSDSDLITTDQNSDFVLGTTGGADIVTEIELRGLVTGPGGEQFLIALHYGDGHSENRNVGLDEMLIPPWKTREFDPDRNTLTITDGNRLVIIQRGTRFSLQDLASSTTSDLVP